MAPVLSAEVGAPAEDVAAVRDRRRGNGHPVPSRGSSERRYSPARGRTRAERGPGSRLGGPRCHGTSDRLREVAPPHAHRGAVLHERPRGSRGHDRWLARSWHRRAARAGRVSFPRSRHAAAPGGPQAHEPRRHRRDGGAARVHPQALVGEPPSQPDGVLHQATPLVRAGGGGHQRAVPPADRHTGGEGLMDREAAVALCREKCLKETTVRHLISVEGVMRGLARRFGQDEELWGLTGLFHDLDQDHTGDDAANHARLAAEWLREAAVDERVINGVLAHAYEEYRTDLMSKAVVHADAVAGLLVAAALVRPERSAGMKVSSVKKKLKEKSFAPGVNRDEVTGVEAGIGLPLDEFLAVSIEGLQAVAPESGMART